MTDGQFYTFRRPRSRRALAPVHCRARACGREQPAEGREPLDRQRGEPKPSSLVTKIQ